MEALPLERPEAIEREAYRDLLCGAGSTALRRRLGLSAEPCGRALVLRSTALDHTAFNRAFGVHRDGPDAEALAESIVARYRAQRIAHYVVQVPAGAEPCATCERLHALGLRREPRRWHKLVRGRAELPAERSPLRIERAHAGDAQAVARLLADGLNLPDAADELFAAAVQRPRWHAYLVRNVQGAPYATLLMYAHAGRAYLALAATDRRERRRGAERTLIAAAVQEALDLGCSELVAETAEPLPGHASSSHHNLVHNGFAVVRKFENWSTPVEGRPG